MVGTATRGWRGLVGRGAGTSTLLLCLIAIPGCAGEIGALAALTFALTTGLWILGRERQRRLFLEAEGMRRAIARGGHRKVERRLRRELALAAAGETIGAERVWLARAQLAELLIAEWRLEEAASIYASEDPGVSPHLRALAAFGRHELEVLCEPVDEVRLATIRRDRDACLEVVPEAIRRAVARAWGALEGVAMLRAGRPSEAIKLLERGLDSVSYNPAQIVYVFHLAQAYDRIGAREQAIARYEEAVRVFPGTRLASEASARLSALSHQLSGFRGMLPEAPSGPSL